MRDADNPVDFIRNNLRQPEGPNPQEMVDATRDTRIKEGKSFDDQAPQTGATPETNKPQQNAKTESTTEYDIDLPGMGGGDAKVQNKTGAPSASDNGGDEDLLGDDEDTPTVAAAENFRKLRTKLRETSKTLKETATAKELVEQELTKFKTGEVVPEVIAEKEQEIARLSKYEKLLDLKVSPEYQESFVKPLTQIKNKLGEIAADYQIPKEVVEKALNITNRAELNGFLSDHFDDVGALEVKQLVTEARRIQGDAQRAEAEPARALEVLLAQQQQVAAERDIQRKKSIASTSKEGWVEALTEIRQEGKASELIMKENDPEFNDKFVRPHLTRAATEYGKIITELAEAGITHLPKTLAKVLAKAAQYSTAAGLAIVSREAALEHAQTIEENTRRTNKYSRPGIGSGNSGGGGGGASGPQTTTPQDAASQLLNKVMGSASGR